jgi:TatD DNase family protein
MFLHSRTSESHGDLVAALKGAGWGDRGAGWKGGVVHSFTGTKAEVQELVSAGVSCVPTRLLNIRSRLTWAYMSA